MVHTRSYNISAVFEAKSLARWFLSQKISPDMALIQMVGSVEDAGSHDFKINVFPLKLYAKPSDNHAHKTTNLK